jgi:hypothetical protein
VAPEPDAVTELGVVAEPVVATRFGWVTIPSIEQPDATIAIRPNRYARLTKRRRIH